MIRDADVVAAELAEYGRRWNYGSLTLRGRWTTSAGSVHGVVVSLGLEPAADESCNGSAVLVSDVELARLDHRERDYERTDVTDLVRLDVGDTAPSARVVTYVPRPSAVERYLLARDAGRAAVRRSYWELVHAAFEELGDDHLARFVAATPIPDVPVADIALDRPHPDDFHAVNVTPE